MKPAFPRIKFQFELTDTFGGEANYDWVRRATHEASPVLSQRALVQRAKKFAGLTGIRCKVSNLGEMIEIRPTGICQILFVTWED